VANQAAASILPSLGASGAIYSCVIITALGFPEAQVSLFIPPTYPIPIQWGVGGLLALDITGVLRGWRFVNVYSMSPYTDRLSIQDV
jgi:rhomboid-like protein